VLIEILPRFWRVGLDVLRGSVSSPPLVIILIFGWIFLALLWTRLAITVDRERVKEYCWDTS
jgi:hypothetical protein